MKKKNRRADRERYAPDYSRYVPTKTEKCIWITGLCLAAYSVGLVFYRDTRFALLMLITVPLFYKMLKNRARYKRQTKLTDQFRVFISALNNSIQISAKPLELAFFEALEDMRGIYSEDDLMIREMGLIETSVKNNNARCIEAEFDKFARRTHIPDIIDFASVLITCHNTNISAISNVISSTAEVIGDKIDVKNEARSFLTEQKTEFLFLMCTPTAFILAMHSMLGSYMDVMYSSLAGRIIMTAALAVNAIGLFYGLSITGEVDN